MSIVELKTFAKENIKGRLWDFWKPYLVVMLISFFIGVVESWFPEKSTVRSFMELFVSLATIPMSVGLIKYQINYTNKKDLNLSYLFDYYKYFLPIIAVGVIISIATSMGMILFIIPGIIIALGLSLSYYLIAINPELDVFDTIKKSWELMKGHKMDAFILSLSFIGWILLGICTLCILYIWLIPYMTVTLTKFYLNIIKKD